MQWRLWRRANRLWTVRNGHRLLESLVAHAISRPRRRGHHGAVRGSVTLRAVEDYTNKYKLRVSANVCCTHSALRHHPDTTRATTLRPQPHVSERLRSCG